MFEFFYISVILKVIKNGFVYGMNIFLKFFSNSFVDTLMDFSEQNSGLGFFIYSF